MACAGWLAQADIPFSRCCKVKHILHYTVQISDMNDLLLQEVGTEADSFISTCEDLRWRRQIVNKEFDKVIGYYF